MSQPFDPNRTRPASEGDPGNADFYRLLGLPTFEPDISKIAAKIEAVAALIHKRAPSDDPEAARLLASLVAARRELLDPIRKTQYDDALRQRSTSLATGLPVGVPVATAVNNIAPSESGGLSAVLWKDRLQTPNALKSARPLSTWRDSIAAWAGFIVACLVLAVMAYWYWQVQLAKAPMIELARQPAPQTAPAAAAPPAEAPITVDDAKPPTVAEPPVRHPLRVVVPEDEPAKEATTPDAERPRPAPPPAAKQSSVTLRRVMNHARQALVKRELPRAHRQLELAEVHAVTPEEKAQLRELGALAGQLDLFWAAVGRGLAKLEATEELHIGSVIAMVVEADPQHVAVFIEGSRRDYTLATLPAKLARYLATTGADEKAPATQAFMAAFQITDPQGDRHLAAQLLRNAEAGGEKVEDLTSLLNEGTLTMDRQPVPGEEEVAAAVEQVKETFGPEIQKAISVERKTALAEDLLRASHDSADAAEQYALLVQTVRWSTAAGTPEPALTAIDELSQWFEVDALVLKAKALDKALDVSGTSTGARQIARAALELSALADHLVRESDAQALADIALSAARKARDPELIKKASVLRKAVDKPDIRSGKTEPTR